MVKLKVKVESMEHDKGVLVEMVDKLGRLEKMLVNKWRPHLGGEFQPFAKWWDFLDLS